MRSIVLAFLFISTLSTGFAQVGKPSIAYNLSMFLEETEDLNEHVNKVYDQLSEQERVAQMIITSTGRLGKPYEEVKTMISNKQAGGVIFLSGDPEEFKKQINELNKISGKLPLIFSIDAEPSLFNSRLSNVPSVKKTAELEDQDEVKSTAKIIDSTIMSLGFQHNYAPVIDLSKENEAIGNRSFGSDSSSVVPMAQAFVEQSIQDGVVPTVKHFPGHGRVSGDTHKKLVYINGELTELSIYKPFISSGVPCIMVGHIAIENNEKYNTNELPSTCSDVVVKKLLREELGFEGIIITDAMNMGALKEIENSTLLAAKAGCDMILMPPNEQETIQLIIAEMKANEDFDAQIEESVKRIIKLKLCLGMRFN